MSENVLIIKSYNIQNVYPCLTFQQKNRYIQKNIKFSYFLSLHFVNISYPIVNVFTTQRCSLGLGMAYK